MTLTVNIINSISTGIKYAQKPRTLQVAPQNLKYVPDTFTKKIPEAYCRSHKSLGNTEAFGVYPQEYVKVVKREYIPAKPEHYIQIGGREWLVKAREGYWKEVKNFKPHYFIDKLVSHRKGAGTSAIQNVLRQSLADSKTQGRVMLDATCIDGETCPGGFYYKLGFRYSDNELNKEFAQWLESGGKREDAPWGVGLMYLPKENIQKCLNYGK